MSRILRKRFFELIRRIIVITFYLSCIAIVPLAIMAAWSTISLILHPFGSGVEIDSTGLSGVAAKQRLIENWPSAVNADSVELVNYKYESSRDSYSTWYRIILDRDSALAWGDFIHARQEKSAADEHHEKVEGIRRTVTGPPPLHRQTGVTPAWWSPPGIDVRATEVMKWYKDYYSGVGRATYSAYDDSTHTLWIYEYACQHDLLWAHDSMPEGDPIDATTK
jgi:hypothetical protein